VPVIELACWQLNCAQFDGDSTAGPIPTLFSEDPDSSLENLKKSVQKAHHDYQRAAKAFMMPELVDLEEALQLLKKPR
jgi:hypothetical protein